MKLLDDSYGQRTRAAEWIGGGEGVMGRLLRLGAAVAGIFLLCLFNGTSSSWWIPAVFWSLGLVAVFGLWRLMEWRRRVQRRANPPVRALNLD